jgi:V/A-type H+-transporting ATPase subunit I
MIVEMLRVRVLGPRAKMPATIAALQDASVLHLVDASCGDGMQRYAADPVRRRRRHHLERVLERIERTTEQLAKLGAAVDAPPVTLGEGRAARLVARVAAETSALLARQRALAEERDALRVYQPLFDDLERLLGGGGERRISIYLLLLRSAAALEALRSSLAGALGDGHDLRTHALPSGETIVLLLVPSARTAEIEQLLASARVERAPLPPALAATTLEEALPRMRARLDEVERELARIRDDAAELAHAHGEALAGARLHFHDALLALTAEHHAAISTRAFVVEGWVPMHQREKLAAAVRAVGPDLALETIARSQWRREDAPVVLSNPRLFAPFEALTALLPLPRYGSVDPTPFVAVFFPILFGVVVGDVGYGAVMAAIALVLRLTGDAGGTARKVAKIMGAVAIYSIAFGVLYGELFGDLGERVFGMHALWFDRREAVLAFLVLAVSLGVVHLVLGLIVAAVSRWHEHRREAIGRGLTALMLVLVVVALLALFEWLPAGFLTPIVVALLLAFPIVVILEGATALLDFMTILGHVLSYARVMALGTASVMLAVVANRMVGAFGSVAVGIAFALLFHFVNFAITLFSPTIHVMRLHYVEFFGTFFEPGGGGYHPLAHWSPHAKESS